MNGPASCEFVQVNFPQPGIPTVAHDDLTPEQVAACEANVIAMGQQLGCF